MSVLHAKVEEALKAHVESLSLSGVNVYRGMNNEDKYAPCVIVAAERGEEDFPQSSIFHVPAAVSVIYMAADDTGLIIDQTSATVFEAFTEGDIRSTLEGYTSGLGIYAIYIQGVDCINDEDSWEHRLELDVVCGNT